jgi:hypothetical protein
MSYSHSHSYSHRPRYSHIANSKVYKSTPSPIHISYKSDPSLINTTTRKKNKSGISFIQELEHKEYQPTHHAVDICGSSLHGLASTIQHMLSKGNKVGAIAQVDRCIKARTDDVNRHNGGDTAHLFIIGRLQIFKKQLEDYDTNVKIRIITYDDDTYTFNIIPDMLYIPRDLGGKYKKTHRKNRKNKRTRKIKKRKRVGNK